MIARRRRPWTLALALLGALTAAWSGPGTGLSPSAARVWAGGPGAEGQVVVEDFEQEPLSRWRLHDLGAREASAGGGPGASAQGRLEIGTVGPDGGWLERELPRLDWRGFSTLVLEASLAGGAPRPMRVVVRGGTPLRGLVRRFTLEPGPSHPILLPLADFRDDGGPLLCDFGEVTRLRVQFDDGTAEGAPIATLSEIRLLPGARGLSSSRPTLAERAAIAFPAGATILEGEHFALLTDAAPLAGEDGKRLLARLEEGWKVLVERYRVPGTLSTKVPLHVFATKEAYVAAVARLAERYGATVSPPTSDGFTIFRLPLSSYDPAKGWDRPVYVHEAMHGALCEALEVTCDGNWVQEMAASAVQARLHPASVQVDLSAAFARRASGARGPFLPWKDLLGAPRPPIARYAQLLTLLEFLAARHADRLGKAWAALARTPSPFHVVRAVPVAEALGTTEEALEAEWLAWGREAYPPPPTPPAAPKPAPR